MVAVIVFWVVYGVFLAAVVVLAGCWESFTASSEVVRNCDRWTAQCLAALRFLEYLCHGAVMAMVAPTACGEQPSSELLVFALLFGFNLCSYVAYAMIQDNVAKIKECEIPLEEKCLKIMEYCSCCCGKGRDSVVSVRPVADVYGEWAVMGGGVVLCFTLRFW